MRYPFIVDIVWNLIYGLIKDWQRNPFLFYTEHDLQAELYKRIKLTLEQMGLDKVIGNDKNDKRFEEKYKQQNWNRVSCEPRVRYSDDDSFCKPDIVVWDDLPENEVLKKQYYESDEWPMLFACELKLNWPDKMGKSKNIKEMKNWYEYKDSNDSEKKIWDVEKLKLLLKRHESMYGCTLYLTNHSAEGKHLIWDKLDEEGGPNLWRCYACLPKVCKAT